MKLNEVNIAIKFKFHILLIDCF